jgi:hypothetical protein
MIIVFDILGVVVEIFIFLYVVADLILVVRNNKYQKLWNKEKATRIKIDPNISMPDLCELYVRFCKRNDCKVEF